MNKTEPVLYLIIFIMYSKIGNRKDTAVCSKLIDKSNLFEMDTYVHFFVIYSRKVFSSFGIFLWFWNFENRFRIENFMHVFKKC